MNLINIIDYDEGIKKLARYALERKLVPVFGAGFTAGCQAINGGVPDGKLAKNEMSKLICAEKNVYIVTKRLIKKVFLMFQTCSLNAFLVKNVQNILRIILRK